MEEHKLQHEYNARLMSLNNHKEHKEVFCEDIQLQCNNDFFFLLGIFDREDLTL